MTLLKWQKKRTSEIMLDRSCGPLFSEFIRIDDMIQCSRKMEAMMRTCFEPAECEGCCMSYRVVIKEVPGSAGSDTIFAVGVSRDFYFRVASMVICMNFGKLDEKLIYVLTNILLILENEIIG